MKVTYDREIVYALGTINFLFDRSQTPHINAEELCAALGVSKSSGANKARLIRDMLGMSQFEASRLLAHNQAQSYSARP